MHLLAKTSETVFFGDLGIACPDGVFVERRGTDGTLTYGVVYFSQIIYPGFILFGGLGYWWRRRRKRRKQDAAGSDEAE